jgi:hypothetical protein
MKNCKKIEVYHSLFRETVKDPRAGAKELASALGRCGRGQTISSATRQLDKMYKSKVSFPPHLVLKNYSGFETKAFFCKKAEGHGISQIYWRLYKKKRKSEISSAFYLAGNYDFFVTTRRHDIDLESVGLEVCETTEFYDPIFTIPLGWRESFSACSKKLLRQDFKEGRLPRLIHENLPWGDKHWKIYLSIRKNLRKPMKRVADDVGLFSATVKKHLYNVVLPCCIVANYFFPYGYEYYDTVFLKLHSSYEKSIVESLKCFPCTTYVYTLKEDIILIIFHDSIKKIFSLIRKMEEKGLTEDVLLSVPLASIF